MRTPTVMIIGMVLAPCGLILNLTSTVAPAWRQISGLNNNPVDVTYRQGLWDYCKQTATSNTLQCGLTSAVYFNYTEVHVGQALMVTSLVVNSMGIALASFGVRCWEDYPSYLVAGFGGLVIFISGVLSLIAVSWYNYRMYALAGVDNLATTSSIQADYALVLGYMGSCLEIIGGFSLALSLVHCCQKCMEKRSRSKTPTMKYIKKASKEKPIKTTYPGSTVYTTKEDNPHIGRYTPDLGYSVGNDNYRAGDASRNSNSVISSPRSYINPIDVTEGERPRSYGRPNSHLSSLPCDSDLL
uniref:Claudin 23 n=1 Tax=Leptobrachium leishanense TaxID=445787 RepID=A0A8C5MCE7_9ANUR